MLTVVYEPDNTSPSSLAPRLSITEDLEFRRAAQTSVTYSRSDQMLHLPIGQSAVSMAHWSPAADPHRELLSPQATLLFDLILPYLLHWPLGCLLCCTVLTHPHKVYIESDGFVRAKDITSERSPVHETCKPASKVQVCQVTNKVYKFIRAAKRLKNSTILWLIAINPN